MNDDKWSIFHSLSQRARPRESANILPRERLVIAPDSLDLDCVEDACRLIVNSLLNSATSDLVNSIWETTFSESECPVCLEPAGRDLKLIRSTDDDCGTFRSSPLLQSDPPIPTCLKPVSRALDSLKSIGTHRFPCPNGGESLMQAAWVKRAITRNRDEPEVDLSYSFTVVESNYSVEILYPFDFHALRHSLNGGDAVFVDSLYRTRAVRPTGGKSNSRFAISSDDEFIIKSINSKEEEFVRRFGPAFFWYAIKSVFQGMPSLLMPLLGVYTVTSLKTKRRRSFVVMRNIASSGSLHMFDLKGVGMTRHVLTRRRAEPGKTISVEDSSPDSSDHPGSPDSFGGNSARVLNASTTGFEQRVLWDQDFRAWSNNRPLLLSPSDDLFFQTALCNDSEFLSSLQVVDYSLFLAMNSMTVTSRPPYTIFAGIIDYLRPFTWDKKIESVVKSVNNNIVNIGYKITNSDPSQPGLREGSIKQPDMAEAPTVIRPDLYARRFQANISVLFTHSTPAPVSSTDSS